MTVLADQRHSIFPQAAYLNPTKGRDYQAFCRKVCRVQIYQLLELDTQGNVKR